MGVGGGEEWMVEFIGHSMSDASFAIKTPSILVLYFMTLKI